MCGCSPAALSRVLVDLREDDVFAAQGQVGRRQSRCQDGSRYGIREAAETHNAWGWISARQDAGRGAARETCTHVRSSTGHQDKGQDREGPDRSGRVP